jgi:Family of unknown function (DUF6328)
MAGDPESDARDPGEELIELLNELRVALPGAQVLFAFLLAIPFTNKFPTLNAFQHDVYFVALMSAVAGTVLLIAPSSLHRLLWRQEHTERILVTSNRLAIAGMVFVALAMVASVLLIADLLYARWIAAAWAGVAAALFGIFWYAVPLGQRVRKQIA